MTFDVALLERAHPPERVASSTYSFIARAVERAPDGNAITFLPSGDPDATPVNLSRNALLQRMHRVANALHALGVGPQDVVSFLLPNVIDAHAIFWGTQAAAIVNPVNFLLGPQQIAAILNAVRTKVLFALGPHPGVDIWEKVQAVRAQTPTLQAVIVLGGPTNAAQRIYGYDELLAGAPDGSLSSGRTIAAHDIAAIFHTSGTTGHPKLVRHSHRNEVYGALSMALLLGFDERDVVNCGMPMFHVAGPVLMSLAPLGSGAQVLIPTASGMRDRQVLQNFWRIIERHRLTVPGGVPTSLLELAQAPLGAADISSARFALTGGAPLSIGLARRFSEHCGLEVRQVYGMTETAGIIAGAPPGLQLQPGQLGVRAPFVEIKIARMRADNTVEACAPGEKGEIFVRGPNVAPYHHQEQLDDGWLNSGDIGCLDECGVLSITGRSKDVIIRSGHNIEPDMIEETAMQHPAVSACVAVGQPDGRAGEAPVLFVLLKDGVHASADSLKDFVCSRVPEPPAKPTEVFIIDSLPLTAAGKIFRPQLRCWAIQRVIERELAELPAPPGASCRIAVTLDGGSMIKSLVTIERSSAGASTGAQMELERYKQDVLGRLNHYPIELSVEYGA